MPRKRKSARLHLITRDGRSPVWQIRDGTIRLSTRTSSREEAETIFVDYLQRKQHPSTAIPPQELSISRALAIYAEEHATHLADPARISYAIEALDAFWMDQPVSSITGYRCREYSKSRMTKFGRRASDGTIRRELNVLQAAVNYCHAEGYLVSVPRVTMPRKPPPRERWLTRSEAAWLLRAARSLNRDGRHLADFILHGLYTGSRKATILAMHIDTRSISGGYVDTETGVLYRKPNGKVETSKRQRPARLPPQYLAYLRLQARRGRKYVVQDYRGRRVSDIRKGFYRAKLLAAKLAAARGVKIDLSEVTPHTLKHTAITWALQNGATPWDAAGYFSTSIDTIERVYGHHSPDHQKTAVRAMSRHART